MRLRRLVAPAVTALLLVGCSNPRDQAAGQPISDDHWAVPDSIDLLNGRYVRVRVPLIVDASVADTTLNEEDFALLLELKDVVKCEHKRSWVPLELNVSWDPFGEDYRVDVKGVCGNANGRDTVIYTGWVESSAGSWQSFMNMLEDSL